MAIHVNESVLGFFIINFHFFFKDNKRNVVIFTHTLRSMKLSSDFTSTFMLSIKMLASFTCFFLLKVAILILLVFCFVSYEKEYKSKGLEERG